MSEQVINIRDRIEKMRTQMTGPNEAVARNKVVSEDKLNNKSENTKRDSLEDQKSTMTPIQPKKIKDIPHAKENLVKVENIGNEEVFEKKNFESNSFNQSNFDSKPSSASTRKTYRDYHNDNIYDENKKSVRLDEDQAFPQFNLNVSNPISWKLMLLIMLMQLLTNIMLVVVLYLK